ncbi:MAG: two-component system response regulator RstA, partial [Serratia proteamaculans]
MLNFVILIKPLNMHKIVFVEDDPEVGKLIAAYLGKHDI